MFSLAFITSRTLHEHVVTRRRWIVCIFTPFWQTLPSHISHRISSRQNPTRESAPSCDVLLTGHRLPAGSWAAGWWSAPRWSGGWWACACSAGKKWWTAPLLDEPQRGQRWGPWCWCRSLGKPLWHSKCQPSALESKQEHWTWTVAMSVVMWLNAHCVILTIAFLLHKSEFASGSVCR